MATALAVPLLGGSGLLTFCRLFTPSARLLVMATAFVPFALAGYLVAAIVCLGAWRFTARVPRWVALRRILLGVGVGSLLGVGLHGALLLPSYAGAHASGRADLTVHTTNLRYGLGDPGDVTRIADRGHADVVVVDEITPEALARLSELREDLPYSAGLPFEGARGTMVFSRYPLERIYQTPVFQGTWTMRVAAPEPFWLVAVHTSQPAGSVDSWAQDHRYLSWAAAVALKSGPVVMAGDFNATLDHEPMRDLLGLGFADAARQSNAGWQPTWPGDPDVEHAAPFGIGLVAIDHVLVSRQFSAISTRTYRIDGSDHRALLARLAVR